MALSSRVVSLPLLCLLLSLLCTRTHAMYDKNDAVVELTTANFASEVLKSSDPLTLVEFYAFSLLKSITNNTAWGSHHNLRSFLSTLQQSGSSQSMAPEYKKAAKALKGIAKVGAVDMTKHESFAQRYEIKGFPTILYFVKGVSEPLTYSGGRTSDDFVSFVKREIKARESMGDAGSKKEGKKDKKDKKSAVLPIDLTESTFEQQVLKSDDLWLVEFMAPWCGHCKALTPEYKKAAAELGDLVKLGVVDATVSTNLAAKYDIKGYPTLKVFKPGKKDKPEDYQNGRTATDIVTFMKNLAETAVPIKPKALIELTSASVFEEHCTESTCIIAVLPHILDSQAAGRKAYLDTLKAVVAKNGRKPFSYLWLEIGAQSAFESAISAEFGGIAFPPAIVAVNLKKSRHVMMTGAFTDDGITRFISGIISGAERTVPLANTNLQPLLTTVKAWDGKDAPKPVATEDL